MRESKIEDLLHQRIKDLGGEHRRAKWVGRNGAPDDYIMVHPRSSPRWWQNGFVGWVECKAPKKGPRSDQAREHERMRAFGIHVLVINTPELIDFYFPLPESKQ
jgi:hypothetical protein